MTDRELQDLAAISLDSLRAMWPATLADAVAVGVVGQEERAELEGLAAQAPDEELRAAFADLNRQIIDAQQWPVAALGPLARGPGGLHVPRELKSRERASAVLRQLEATAALRELRPHEARARRALRTVPGLLTPATPRDHVAVQRAAEKRLAKAAKRAHGGGHGTAEASA